MTARRPIQTIDYAGVQETSADANWVGPAGPPYQALAALGVLLLAIVLVGSPALVGVVAIVDAQLLSRILPWFESAAQLFSVLDLVRGLLPLALAGLVLTARSES